MTTASKIAIFSQDQSFDTPGAAQYLGLSGWRLLVALAWPALASKGRLQTSLALKQLGRRKMSKFLNLKRDAAALDADRGGKMKLTTVMTKLRTLALASALALAGFGASAAQACESSCTLTCYLVWNGSAYVYVCS